MLKILPWTSNNSDGHESFEELKLMQQALDKSQAVIQFKPDGTIITANKNFLDTLGYDISEVKDQHHSMFVEPSYKQSSEYKMFWQALARGEYQAAEYKRLGKGGKEVWIQASYNPIIDKNGKVLKVVKYATDITEQTLINSERNGQVEAIGKSQAVIEFEVDGTIITANENFLNAMGYNLKEIKDKHHSLFVDPAFAGTSEYKQFWQSLSNGEFQSAEYMRIAKGGKEVWIQASYNPILDPSGKVFKVVKYATDITEQKLTSADYSGQLEAIGKSQAVIEFELNGTIIKANENFLGALGYSLNEIEGKHHSLFVDEKTKKSPDYKLFWQSLANGEYQAAEYKRIAKSGKEVWIQASYNPIIGPNGQPFKVVKYATDITKQVLARREAERVGALVDENLDKILKAVGEANEQSTSVAAASTQTMETVQAVSAATEEFQASSNEIARSMENSRLEVGNTMQVANSADESTQKLSTAAESMNEIVNVIQDIASQINLLALNATIESARAGEAGKGFAVVASEVKSLANQVGTATTQISENIGDMQSVSGDVIEQLSEIRTSVETVESGFTTVASAVEEQTIASKEIASNMSLASDAVASINTNIDAISGAVGSANEFAEEGTKLYRSLQKQA